MSYYNIGDRVVIINKLSYVHGMHGTIVKVLEDDRYTVKPDDNEELNISRTFLFPEERREMRVEESRILF